jgi:ActR/RegA family two-component response regulator
MLRLLEDDKVEREGFNRCMRARGYTVTVAPR